MTSADLRAWQAALGLTQQHAADQLGVSLATYKRYITVDVPHTVALACSAVAAGLGPWEPPENKP